MHILLIADGRSPTTGSWIQLLQALDYSVSLASTYPCSAVEGIENFCVLPVAFARFARKTQKASADATTCGVSMQSSQHLVKHLRPILQQVRYLLGPHTTMLYKSTFLRFTRLIKPDLMHSLRIPFEGMLARFAELDFPLAVSIWGNDLTLHSHGSRAMHAGTVACLRRTNGLLADTRRDIRLASEMGFNPGRPTLVVPGSGGINLTLLEQPLPADQDAFPELTSGDIPLVINPRGLRPGSVRSDVFFKAIPIVLQHMSEVRFVCPAMRTQPEAESWVQRLNIERNTILLPFLSRTQIWHLFHHSAASISVSEHDGTPNSLLEAMACGCFPIVGDIESLREWITQGVNGMLVKPSDPQALAMAIVTALQSHGLRSEAARINLDLVRSRAEIGVVRTQVNRFYQHLVEQNLEK